MKNVIIIGAGGHGKVIADIILCSGARVLGFLDDNPEAPAEIMGFPVLGSIDMYTQYPDAEYIIGIGHAAIRQHVSKKLHGVKWHTAIHPAAIISSLNVQIGEGSVVAAGAIINPGARIGNHCIINSAAVVEHDCVVEDFAHISVGAKLAGTVRVGSRAWVGVGAAVRNNISVCGDVTIGVGAVVVADITETGTYIGVPARKIT